MVYTIVQVSMIKLIIATFVISFVVITSIVSANPVPHEVSSLVSPERSYISESELADEALVEEKPRVPVTVVIPQIGVETRVEHVGLDSEGRMDVPQGVYNVGWYSLGAKPGEKGNAVFAGHLDTVTGAPAVFYNLANLQIGDEIIVQDENDNRYVFGVTKQQVFPYNDFPIDEVFGSYSIPRLNLITCQGFFDYASSNYSHRTVVFSELVRVEKI